jgi:kumamolisin
VVHPGVAGSATTRVARGRIAAETMWDDGQAGGAGGGGISVVFPVPAYQLDARIPVSANPGGHSGRGVPDICGKADPDTGYAVRVDGQTMTIGGTSVVAPLWAGLIALFNQSWGPASSTRSSPPAPWLFQACSSSRTRSGSGDSDQ